MAYLRIESNDDIALFQKISRKKTTFKHHVNVGLDVEAENGRRGRG